MNKPANYGQLDDLMSRLGFGRLTDRSANVIYLLRSSGLVHALPPHKSADLVRDSDWLSLRHQLEWNGIRIDDDNPGYQSRAA